jgi:hypothetical protein
MKYELSYRKKSNSLEDKIKIKMTVTPGLQKRFDIDYQKKIGSKEGNEAIKARLLSLHLDPELHKKIELIFLAERPEDVLHKDVTEVLLHENQKILWTDRIRNRDAILEIAA